MKARGGGNSRARECAIGITVHTGWGACVVVAGSLREPEIVANRVIEVLEGAERFCYHRAAEMEDAPVQEWMRRVRAKALVQARKALAPLLTRDVRIGAIVAKDGDSPNLQTALATHMRIHSAEGLFYRDILREACEVPCHIVPPDSIDTARVTKLPVKPWGRDQKLAALAAWQVMSD
jgi:hypothetical protein